MKTRAVQQSVIDRVRAAGLEWVERGPGHFQITGGVRIVNFYPFAKAGPRFYLQGMAGGSSGNIDAAIKAARVAPKGSCTEDRHKRHKCQKTKARRAAMLRRDPRCHWCRKQLDASTATLDHVVPLSKGGGNGSDNCVLACDRCNQDRGNKVTAAELRTLQKIPSISPEALTQEQSDVVD